MKARRFSSAVPGMAGSTGMERGPHALTSALVKCIAGPVDDQTVVDVIRTGASEDQLILAVERAKGDKPLRPPRGADSTIDRLVRILSPALAGGSGLSSARHISKGQS